MNTVERSGEAVRLTGVTAYGVRFADLVVRYGEVVVLAGPNGAGKSTISRAVVGELTTGGSVQVLGADPVAADLKGRIGYLVKDMETMGSLTSRDVLDICAAVRGCGTAYAHRLADRLELDLDRPMAELCRGQLRRLGIVQALMHQPELVVLDDPMTELDDAARQVVPVLLQEAADRGAAVLVTAQADTDAEQCAGRIVTLRIHEDFEAVPEPSADLDTDGQGIAEFDVSGAGEARPAERLAGRGRRAGGLEIEQPYDGQYDESPGHRDRDQPDRDPRGTTPPGKLLGVVRSHPVQPPITVRWILPSHRPVHRRPRGPTRSASVRCGAAPSRARRPGGGRFPARAQSNYPGGGRRRVARHVGHGPSRGHSWPAPFSHFQHTLAGSRPAGQKCPLRVDRTALVRGRRIPDDGRDSGNSPGGRTRP